VGLSSRVALPEKQTPNGPQNTGSGFLCANTCNPGRAPTHRAVDVLQGFVKKQDLRERAASKLLAEILQNPCSLGKQLLCYSNGPGSNPPSFPRLINALRRSVQRGYDV
jgi:hypothetical protein